MANVVLYMEVRNTICTFGCSHKNQFGLDLKRELNFVFSVDRNLNL